MKTLRNLFVVAVLAAPALSAMAQEAAKAAGPAPDALLMRWLHVLGAVALLGGGIFVRLVLIPSAGVLSAETSTQFSAALRSRWSKVVMIAITLLLVSGFYNYLVIAIPAHKGQGPYHMVMGMKIILAFVVFFLASLLAGKTGLAQKLQANAGLWTAVTVALGILIVLMGGFLKFMPTV